MAGSAALRFSVSESTQTATGSPDRQWSATSPDWPHLDNRRISNSSPLGQRANHPSSYEIKSTTTRHHAQNANDETTAAPSSTAVRERDHTAEAPSHERYRFTGHGDSRLECSNELSECRHHVRAVETELPSFEAVADTTRIPAQQNRRDIVSAETGQHDDRRRSTRTTSQTTRPHQQAQRLACGSRFAHQTERTDVGLDSTDGNTGDGSVW